MKKLLRIAIDGPSGAGKSTIARKIADRLNLQYVDTGAMYRALAYKLIKTGADVKDTRAVEKVLKDTDIDYRDGFLFLDGKLLGDEIRSARISMMASDCSAIAAVRDKLGAIQKKIGRTDSVVMDGRDIATNIMKDAEIKIFLSATAEERANRRFKEMTTDSSLTYEDVLKDINKRDENDMGRKINPLRPAKDSILIDSTNMSIEQVLDRIIEEVEDGSNKSV